MPLLLSRVDDRLIHGQVVLGWGRPLGLERIVLVDDDVAGNDWEQELYRMAVPAGIEVVFASVAGAASQLGAWQSDRRRTALLTGTIEAMASLHDADPDAMHRINLGGVHHQPGRTERLPYLYLSDAELAFLRRLAADGADIVAQDVPTAPRVGLDALR
ncbi:MAG TPA: PTS sugar transporter subunit IIB [Gemmatimonadales bacterium]|nr:PTS sugar transporter subunit IIB [Gemmatimonadales bacterium]